MDVIRINSLTKKFNELVAVNSISFNVKEGEIFGFLGPNGAGKTTTLSMLATLLSPTSGEAFVNNFNIRTERDNVRKSIGMVFQDPTLDEELTAYENMDFHGRLYRVPKETRKKRILELMRLVELEDRKDSLVKTFSGGMRRRLEIARGLLHEPKVLFLDEPTLGLDPQTRNKLWDYIKKLNREKNLTIILTTHYMDEADKLCDRIAIIDHGKIVASGTSASMKSQIGGDVITIETPDTEKLDLFLKKCSWCRSTSKHDGSITISVEHAEKNVANVVKLAGEHGITISLLTISKPSLEDVFLHFTGRTIREEEASPQDHMRLRRRVWRR